jgi:hypothetical protein
MYTSAFFCLKEMFKKIMFFKHYYMSIVGCYYSVVFQCMNVTSTDFYPFSFLLKCLWVIFHFWLLRIKQIWIFFGSTRVWTQDLILGRQAVYHLSHSTSPFCVGYFWDRVFQTILFCLFVRLVWDVESGFL